MAATLGDLIQVTDFQTYLEQQVLNVYYYRITSVTGLGDGYLSDLNDIFIPTVLEPCLELQVSQLSHVSREWRNLSNGTDLFTDSVEYPGVLSVSSTALLPSYVSLGFLMRRETLATRNGYKRIAGIPDTAVNGNDVTYGGSQIADFETAIAADLVGGLITLAEPVIVKRPIEVPVGSYVYSSVGSGQFRGVGTQNSRKRGRGV